jgi:DNA-binding transcriptional LysR family regulator
MFGNTDMRYSLRQLEVFLAVARSESVSRAAQALAMSQSAASGSLADLERQFEVRLFDRVGKRLQLSELGRSVRARAEAALDQAQAFERALQSGEVVGRLRVGATLTIGNHLAVPLLARFMRDNPGAQATLAVANTEEIARQVANFEIDVGLIEGEIEHPDLEVTVWRDDELVVFCAPAHPLARKPVLRDPDLRAGDLDRARAGIGHPPDLRPGHARAAARAADHPGPAAHRGDPGGGAGGAGAGLRVAAVAGGVVRARDPAPVPGPAPGFPAQVLLPAAPAEGAQRGDRALVAALPVGGQRGERRPRKKEEARALMSSCDRPG